MNDMLDGLTVSVAGISGTVGGESVELGKSRLAIVDNPSNQSTGWLRWILDTNEFDFTLITEADIRDGRLADRFDTILLMNPIYDSAGRARGRTVPEYVKTEFDRFVRDGGTLVAWGRNADYAGQVLSLDLQSAAGMDSDFGIPGSVLRSTVDTGSPYTFGMQDNLFVFYNSSCTAWGAVPGTVLGQYPAGNPLYSGYALGGEKIGNTPNVFFHEIGDGGALLIGFDPMFRAQPLGTFKLFFNAILFSGRK